MDSNTNKPSGEPLAAVDVGSGPLLAVGDLVRYKPQHGLLRAGCQQYDRAVVASLTPFVLVSESGDMRWSATVAPEGFEKCGEAGRTVLLAVIGRFKRELFPANPKMSDGKPLAPSAGSAD